MRETSTLLSAWNSFYVMVGSSAAALTGLMFVVMSLVSDKDRDASTDGVSTFSTPTVVHFSYALFTAALMSAPFWSLVPIAISLGVAGVSGLLYVISVARRTAKLTTYHPDTEDWVCNILLPFIAYALFVSGAIALHSAPRLALYAPAVAVMLLVFVGIHNAWDVVTFLATGKAQALREQSDRGDAKGASSD